MTTLALIFLSVCLLGGVLVLCAVAKGARTRNPFPQQRRISEDTERKVYRAAWASWISRERNCGGVSRKEQRK